MSVNSKLIERFFRVLVEEIRSKSPRYLRESFTVAEIYQSLVPYRTHRDRIGVEINGDYEDALLRLLAGEGGFLNLESDAARERIRRELQYPNPNTGLYREFAAVEVKIDSSRVPTDLDRPPSPTASKEDADGESPRGDASGAGSRSAEGTSDRSRPGGRSVSPAEKGGAAPGQAVAPAPKELPRSGSGSAETMTARSRARGESPSDDERAPKDCPECGEGLPGRETLRFCPFCGTNVFVIPCSKCGEVLERSWRYCVSCGTAATD